MQYQISVLQNEQEYRELLTFVGRMVTQQFPYCYALPGDLDWWRRSIALEQALSEITIWRSDGHIVGFGWVNGDQIDSIYDGSDPHVWRSIVEYFHASHNNHTFWALQQQTQRQSVLEEFGYRKDNAEFRMHFIDTQYAPKASIPTGYTITHVDDTTNDSRAACQRSAFNSTKMTGEIYCHVRTLPSYTTHWDRIIVNSANEVVAFCTIWVDAVSGHALFEPVGCHQAYQRRGLTRALICQSLQDLAIAGVRTAHVMSVSDVNNPAVHLYRSCGFQFIDELVPWRAE
jgi:ribosomal protein S18 acetylase RimI-like enzyme